MVFSENRIAISRKLWYGVLLKGDGLFEKANNRRIAFIACVALCAAVWPRSARDGDLPAVPVKTAVNAETETHPEKIPELLLSGDNPAHEVEVIAESEPPKTEITAEEKTESAPPAELTFRTTSKSIPTSTDPKPGTIAVIDGNRCMWVPGFGWVKDEGGSSQGTMVGSPGDELTGNKVGQMGGGTIVDGKGDINKQVGIPVGADNTQPFEKHNPAPGSKAVINGKPSVWIPGFGWIEDNGGGNIGTVVEDMYENGNKIGSMD